MPPYNLLNRICINFDKKRTEIVHLWLSKIHILLWKEGMSPCNHQKLYISVNLDKKSLKWCNLARKIQNFLRQGGTAPLRPPKLYIGLCINFDRKGTKIVHLWFRNTHSFKKRRTAPCLATTRNHNSSEIQTKKGLKLCIFGSQNTIFLSGKGHFPLANPARGQPPGPCKPRTSAQSACFAGSWAPPCWNSS